MDMLICNKCCVPIHRGKQPYNITQCAHIFCQNCLQQAEKQCPQCGYNGPISLPLKEPLTPTVVQFFVPYTEALEQILKAEMFRSNQMKIMMQRLRDLDKKYEILKAEYFTLQRNVRGLIDKYKNMKTEKENLDKKLLHCEMLCNTPLTVFSAIRMPADSAIFTQQSNTRYSSESLDFLNSADVMTARSTEPGKQHRTCDGFRIPSNRKVPKSIGSLNTTDMSLKNSFMR